MRKKPSIFLSYAREDISSVNGIYEKLIQTDFKPWMDKQDIEAGQQWKRSIKQVIREADFIFIFLSAHAVTKRGFLQVEIKEALETWKEKLASDNYLIPILIEPCKVPMELSEFQYVELYEVDSWSKVEKAVLSGMKRRQKEKSNKSNSRVPSHLKQTTTTASTPKEPANSERTAETNDTGGL